MPPRDLPKANEADARFELAQALLATGGDRSRAIAQASKAADEWRAAGDGKAAELAEVEACLARTRPG